MIINSVKTAYGLKIDIARKLNVVYKPLLNTTINERLNILPNYEIVDKIYPTLNTLMIGVGGTPLTGNSSLNLRRANHSVKDGFLFKNIPMLVKPMGTQLTEFEKTTYRLKRVENTLNGDYDCYYGLVLDNFTYDNNIYKINNIVSTPNMSRIDTETDNSILSPVPVVNKDLASFNGEYIVNTAKVNIILTPDIINNITEGNVLINPDLNINNITEIALCTSIEVDSDYGKEMAWCQVDYFIDVNLDMQTILNTMPDNKTMSYMIDIGGMEPLAL